MHAPNELTTLVSRRAVLAPLGLATLAAGVPWTWRSSLADIDNAQTNLPTDAELSELLQLAGVPSISIARVDGERMTTRTVGVLRAGSPETANAETVYAAASLTKMIFAYTLLGLVQDGVISLDRPVREYLPLPNADDARAATITARHLLSHTSGWRNWRNNTTQLLTADFEPGTRWSYSGEGFFFLQRIVEHITGKSVGEIMRERVFVPLGMSRTSMLLTDALETNRASGHDGRGQLSQPFGRATLVQLRRSMSERGMDAGLARVEDAEQAIRTAEPTLPVLPNFLSPNAAASLVTSASDFARFLRHLVLAPKRGGRDAAIVAAMMSPQIRCNARVQWGLGVGLEDVGAKRYAWQWGDNPGYKNFVFADPANAQAMVVFSNGDRGARVYERVIRAMTGEDHPGFLWA